MKICWRCLKLICTCHPDWKNIEFMKKWEDEQKMQRQWWGKKAKDNVETLFKILKERTVKLQNENDLIIPELFKAEDFAFYGGTKELVEMANARFKEWAGGLEKVVSRSLTNKDWNKEQLTTDKVVALLAFPQELPKKKCEHEPISYSEGCSMSYERMRWILANKAECKKCGAKLKAVWREE